MNKSEPPSYIFLDRRRPCFECSLSLHYIKGKGYYAVIVNVNGTPQYMHKWCAEQRESEDYIQYVEDVLDAKQHRREIRAISKRTFQ